MAFDPSPWGLVKKSEHSHQRALFAWANCAAIYGIGQANRVETYTLKDREQWGIQPIVPRPELSLLFAIHNQGHGDKIRGAQAAAEGIKAGVPDICLPVPTITGPTTWHGALFIELKRPKGSLQANQSDWIARLREQGYRAEICVGWEAARDVIIDYLG